MNRTILVIEGQAAWARVRAEATLEQARADGWRIVDPSEGTAAAGAIWHGIIDGSADAQKALVSVLNGAGLVALIRCEREITDRLLDDLRRLGAVEHITADDLPAPTMTRQQRALLELLGEGLTLAEAAWQLGLSRRTADRRLAAARDVLGVRTTAEAVIAARIESGAIER